MKTTAATQARKIVALNQRPHADTSRNVRAELDYAAPYSATTLRLALADIARSGFTSEQAFAEGMFPTDDASSVNPDFAKAPAIIIPYFDSNGRPLTYERDGLVIPFCRARYLAAPGFIHSRKRRYDQPSDSGTPPYFPRSFDWSVAERGELETCLLVEGEKKAIALCCAGFPAIAIGGVFNFSDGSAQLHPALANTAGRCRAVHVVFDSDAVSKPQIQVAEWRLAGQLALLGVRVHIVRIPADGDEKIGADDFVVRHGAAAFGELVSSTPPLGTALLPTNKDEFTVPELLSRNVAPIEELFPGWVEKGIPNFIAGPGGVHKSRLALQWGLCVDAGVGIWGMPAGKATLVYVSAEDDENEIARRTQAIASQLPLHCPRGLRRHSVAAGQGILIPRKGKDSALVIMGEGADVEVRPFYHELVARLQAIPGHKVVVLDSAYDFVRFVGRAKIDEDAVNYFIKVVLQGLCDQTDTTLLIPWHPSQAGSERESMDGWSVAWHNAPRARLALKAVKDTPDTYELSVTKRNHGRKGEPLRLRFYEGVLLPADAVPDDGKAAAVHAACVEAALYAATIGAPFTLQRNIAPKIVEDISKKAGVALSSRHIKDELQTACHRGELRYQKGHGKAKAGYFPAPSAALAHQEAVETALETQLKPDAETD